MFVDSGVSDLSKLIGHIGIQGGILTDVPVVVQHKNWFRDSANSRISDFTILISPPFVVFNSF